MLSSASFEEGRHKNGMNECNSELHWSPGNSRHAILLLFLNQEFTTHILVRYNTKERNLNRRTTCLIRLRYKHTSVSSVLCKAYVMQISSKQHFQLEVCLGILTAHRLLTLNLWQLICSHNVPLCAKSLLVCLCCKIQIIEAMKCNRSYRAVMFSSRNTY